MNITQKFYDNLAPQYDKLFLDWEASTHEQAAILDKLFRAKGFDTTANILDCACGIGTQSIGLASLGYNITASDISQKEIEEAEKRAENANVKIRFEIADFCNLAETFSEKFGIIIAMDNALPHLLSHSALETAIKSITDRLTEGGIFVASIRDYDAILKDKPPYSPPYIHKTENGQRVSFQTWEWHNNCYKLIQYIIDDQNSLQVSKFECEYRATLRDELTNLLTKNGCNKVQWLFPDDTGYYQPVVIACKS